MKTLKEVSEFLNQQSELFKNKANDAIELGNEAGAKHLKMMSTMLYVIAGEAEAESKSKSK